MKVYQLAVVRPEGLPITLLTFLRVPELDLVLLGIDGEPLKQFEGFINELSGAAGVILASN